MKVKRASDEVFLSVFSAHTLYTLRPCTEIGYKGLRFFVDDILKSF